VEHEGAIKAFLQQRMDEHTPAAEAWSRLSALSSRLGGAQ
jgi:flagellum-specific ATP synthase